MFKSQKKTTRLFLSAYKTIEMTLQKSSWKKKCPTFYFTVSELLFAEISNHINYSVQVNIFIDGKISLIRFLGIKIKNLRLKLYFAAKEYLDYSNQPGSDIRKLRELMDIVIHLKECFFGISDWLNIDREIFLKHLFKSATYIYWWQVDIGDKWMLPTKFGRQNFDIVCWFPTLRFKDKECWWQKLPKSSSTSQSCHYHITSPTSVTNVYPS